MLAAGGKLRCALPHHNKMDPVPRKDGEDRMADQGDAGAGRQQS